MKSSRSPQIARVLSIVLIAGSLHAKEPVVVHEDLVTRFAPADNGASPMWCYGSPLIVRHGNDVYVSIIETGDKVPPLCNTRWQIWKRQVDGWQKLATEQNYRQREPCPLVSLPDAGLFVSSNPSLTSPGTWYRACEPTVMNVFDDRTQGTVVRREMPVWSEAANFTDHSYRGFAADAERNELLLLNIDSKTSEQFVSLRDASGQWSARRKIVFPIRSAYPQVAMRNGAAHVMAIGDIREPNAEWQTLKREVTKREWDYVFRRLFYCVAPNIGGGSFQQPIEVDSVEQTAGHILNLDLHIDETGAAHLLYLKRPHQHAFIRDKYFPGQPMTAFLEHVVIRSGQVESRRTIARTPTSAIGIEPIYARFHIASDEQIWIVMAAMKKKLNQPDRLINLVQGLHPKTERHEIRLQHPFRVFFTSGPRGGSKPSRLVEMFGTADDVPNLRYAAIRLNSL